LNWFILAKLVYISYTYRGLGIGDWGLPNPQSPIPNIF